MKRLAALVMTTALALGGVAGTASAASTSGTVTVKGHVTSPTGKPVAGVRVSVRAKPALSQSVSRVVRTSKTGRYEVHVPRGVHYDLRVTDPGDDDRDTADGTWAPTYRRITSSAASIRANQVVHHGAQVSGHVYDSSGAAVTAGLVVTAWRRTPNTEGRTTLNRVGTTYTQADGTYHFRNLPAVAVVLSFAPPSKNNAVRFRTGHPGGSRYYADATAVQLVFGTKFVGLSLRFPVAGRISGSLTVDGKALPGGDDVLAEVHLLDAAGTEIDREPALSAFSFPELAAGTYLLRFEVTAPGGELSAPEYYADSSTLAGATPITVEKGQAVTGLSVALTTR
jgi:5-hydroxyisourate hydrolase-like protein (transthyretin family)